MTFAGIADRRHPALAWRQFFGVFARRHPVSREYTFIAEPGASTSRDEDRNPAVHATEKEEKPARPTWGTPAAVDFTAA
jgi:hypothetical protein